MTFSYAPGAGGGKPLTLHKTEKPAAWDAASRVGRPVIAGGLSLF